MGIHRLGPMETSDSIFGTKPKSEIPRATNILFSYYIFFQLSNQNAYRQLQYCLRYNRKQVLNICPHSTATNLEQADASDFGWGKCKSEQFGDGLKVTGYFRPGADVCLSTFQQNGPDVRLQALPRRCRSNLSAGVLTFNPPENHSNILGTAF